MTNRGSNFAPKVMLKRPQRAEQWSRKVVLMALETQIWCSVGGKAASTVSYSEQSQTGGGQSERERERERWLDVDSDFLAKNTLSLRLGWVCFRKRSTYNSLLLNCRLFVLFTEFMGLLRCVSVIRKAQISPRVRNIFSFWWKSQWNSLTNQGIQGLSFLYCIPYICSYHTTPPCEEIFNPMNQL